MVLRDPTKGIISVAYLVIIVICHLYKEIRLIEQMTKYILAQITEMS